jgi:glycosyltransferase involved in cell wall biosynthesis
LKNSKLIWLINVGEPLPTDGNRMHRMCAWKTQLEKEGYSVTFFTTDFEHQRKQWINDVPAGFTILKSYIPYKNNISIARLLNHFLLSLSLWRVLGNQNTKADVILVSYPTIWLSFVAIIYARLNNIKLIVDVRDKWPDIFLVHPSLYLVLWPLFLLKRYIFNNTNQLISISPDYYKWALSNKSIDNEYILPLVQPNVIRVERKMLSNSPIKLLFVGSLGTTYNLEMILTIHDTLIQKNIPFQIHICGDGPRKEWLIENIVNRKHIVMCGWLNKDELQLKFDEAHFGLMLYYSNAPQGWPNKLIEYMANGLPMINTLKGESWSLIDKEKLGINFEANNVIELVKWLIELKNNHHTYQNYILRNYALHKHNFTEQSNLFKLLQLL